MSQIALMVITPMLLAYPCLRLRRGWLLFRIALIATSVQSIILTAQVLTQGGLVSGIWRVDALSMLFVITVTTLSTVIGLHASSSMRHEGGRDDRSRRFEALFLALTSLMLLVLTVDSLGLMWIAIEATTLASAPLIAFNSSLRSKEAAWRYIMICSVGIALALMGLTLLYASSVQILDEANALDFSAILPVAASLDPRLLRISFIFAIAGFGTKAGLAPMHSWLPEAHGSAPAPVSAMLSGLLLSCAMYCIMRFVALTSPAAPGFPESLLMMFGLLSIAVAAFSIAASTDLKGMLALSSVEHMGLVSVGLALGGAGVFAALFHILAHAVTKSLLFLTAGEIVHSAGTGCIDGIASILDKEPLNGRLFAVAVLGIAGMPPMPVFVGELLLIMAAVSTGNHLIAAVLLVLLAIVFISMVARLLPMVAESERVSMKVRTRDVWTISLLAMALVLGLTMPESLNELLTAAAMQGGLV